MEILDGAVVGTVNGACRGGGGRNVGEEEEESRRAVLHSGDGFVAAERRAGGRPWGVQQ